MTYPHFSVANSAISETMGLGHGLRWVTHVSGALAFVTFPARQPRLPRQPVDVVARGPAPGGGDRRGPAGARSAFGAVDRRRRAVHRARPRDAGALAAAAA